MFGLSLWKALLIAIVIMAVWRGGRMFEAFNQRVRQRERPRPATPPRAAAVEMVACPRCGAYGARGTPCSCGARVP